MVMVPAKPADSNRRLIAKVRFSALMLVQPASAGFGYQTPVSTGGRNDDRRRKDDGVGFTPGRLLAEHRFPLGLIRRAGPSGSGAHALVGDHLALRLAGPPRRHRPLLPVMLVQSADVECGWFSIIQPHSIPHPFADHQVHRYQLKSPPSLFSEHDSQCWRNAWARVQRQHKAIREAILRMQ
jgi:hypothetical protein